MLWWLLSPIRGTVQPPRLSANHPIRRAFYRHGLTTAQHWLVAMLVSVAIAMAFSYPTIFLSENPTAGFAAYPHHVWTTAKPYEGDPNDADVEMRQIWVHGSYMKALEREVLQSGLDIQTTIVGAEKLTSVFPRLDEKLRSSTLSWGFHSPLMYWNNSRQMIDSDDDILRTINDQSHAASSLNVALRPASVFAGKKFDRHRLFAADALVITLMNKVDTDGGVSETWQERMASLTTGGCEDCTVFPRDGNVTRNRVYEFSFTPLSAKENLALTIAYGLMILYVILSLRRIKAFHSRFGLVVTAITQMTCSILASFTICGILKINLSMIPQNAYPFVVLVIGLENMFRLINAVLAYQPAMATELRIANALGDVGPVSVATAAQNLLILSLLARVVSPGVAAFCAFACIATLFDAFFLLTFFVAVLNVDIRRFELQDALARANQSKHRRKPSPHHHTWFDALVHGKLPFSTRMAGTAVTTTFILSLNYHFFEHREKATSLRHLLGSIRDGPPSLSEFDTFAPPPINASLTPGQWMRMQDFDTAKEVMRLAKPGADSFVIRVFAPLIVVLPGADRTDMDVEEAWTTALRSFALHHFYPVAVAVVFAVTFVAVLMNFLLYNEHEDAPKINLERENEEPLTIFTITLPHKLDIVKLAGTEKGHFVSVGLDKTVAIALFDRVLKTHQILAVYPEALSKIHWPVHNITLEESGEWMACHCADERVLVFNTLLGGFMDHVFRYPDDNPPLLFDFYRLPCAEISKPHLVLLTSGGRLVTFDPETGESKLIRLAEAPLLGAKLQELSSQGRRLVAVTDQGRVVCYSWTNGAWIFTSSQSLEVGISDGRLSGAVSIELHSGIGSEILVATSGRRVIFLEHQTLAPLAHLEAGEKEPDIEHAMLGQSTKCSACGMLAIRCAAVVSASRDGCECAVETLWPEGDDDDAAICLQGSTALCQSFAEAETVKQRLSKPGAWATVASQAVLGYRKAEAQSNGHASSLQARKSSSGLRLRRHARSSPRKELGHEVWEAYKFSLDGEIEISDDIVSSAPADADHDTNLYVSSPGPVVTLDGQSIGVAFGNVVKVVRATRRGSTRRPNAGKVARKGSR